MFLSDALCLKRFVVNNLQFSFRLRCCNCSFLLIALQQVVDCKVSLSMGNVIFRELRGCSLTTTISYGKSLSNSLGKLFCPTIGNTSTCKIGYLLAKHYFIPLKKINPIPRCTCARWIKFLADTSYTGARKSSKIYFLVCSKELSLDERDVDLNCLQNLESDLYGYGC